MKCLLIIGFILTYIASGAIGSFLLAKDLKREFKKIDDDDIPVLFTFLALGYIGLAVGIIVSITPYIDSFINSFFSAHLKCVTRFLNKVVK